MFTCNFCGNLAKTLRLYLLHCKLHRNEPRCLFKCAAAGCKDTFLRYEALKAHFYRKHNTSGPSSVGTVVTDFKCSLALCDHQCQTTKALIAHLKHHIVEGRVVNCPFRGCKKVFHVKSSFTAHISRKHRDLADNIHDSYKCSGSQSLSVHNDPDNIESQGNEIILQTAPNESDNDITEDFSDLFFRNVSLFYLKLQGQFLLPASTIQNIVEEIQNIHELGQTYCLSKLWSLLKNETPLSDEDITNICESVKGSDLFSICHTGPMRTAHSRVQTFKKNFNYVEPKKIFLGRDENRTDRFAYYVPLRKTLKCLLESDLWKKSRQHTSESPSDILSDINDGQIYKFNNFFVENPSCLKLILYQDAFEVVNPLGSAKTRHKILAVYVSVANLPLHVRSDTDHMSLVLLCKEKDFKEFGHSKVLSELLEDLRLLEENGIVMVDETVVKGTVFCIAGDNLGSHCIG
ncbi:uncharacterized protein LOC111606963 [Xiphophorus maculatus]|uniref:uncharacterized protein LOC111606963 n=2 Tax=Xiphophorus TaxID=8082 RepID=UPI000C6DDBB7|nr:uncharacterized protein LOC111606963 [Xiphophorus maculatus]